jgi:hypothetical protein
MTRLVAKKFLLIKTLMVLCALHSSAQDLIIIKPSELREKTRDWKRPSLCPDYYISVSTGLNNNTGLAGFSVDIPVDKTVSLEAGAGVSFWGFKAYGGGRYYFKKRCHSGWAIGGGITHNTGVPDFSVKLATVNGNEKVGLSLYPQTNLLIAGYYYWIVGKKYNRIFVECGGSIPFSGKKFDQSEGDKLSDKAFRQVKFLAPGGPVAAAGFSFGIHT